MAFTPEQKRAYYAAHPELKALHHSRRTDDRRPYWRARKRSIKRRNEIMAAKHALLDSHRLRAIGVAPLPLGSNAYNVDSWEMRP